MGRANRVMEMIKVLHVDDNQIDAQLTHYHLAKLQNDMEFDWIPSAKEALKRINSQDSYHCIVCDFSMPLMTGLDLLIEIRKSGNNIPFIFLTGQADEEEVAKFFEMGANDYFSKDPGFAHYIRLINAIRRNVDNNVLISKYHESWASLIDKMKTIES